MLPFKSDDAVIRYWKRKPTGKEYVVQSVLGINHGALGSVAWNDPTTDDIKASASLLAQALTKSMKDFILSPRATFRHAKVNRVDVGLWTVGAQTLLLATNLNYAETTVSLPALGISAKNLKATQVFDSGAKLNGMTLTFDSVGTGAFLLG